MKRPLGRRTLGFEQMEERLALSTTAVGDSPIWAGNLTTHLVNVGEPLAPLTITGENVGNPFLKWGNSYGGLTSPRSYNLGSFANIVTDGDTLSLHLNPFISADTAPALSGGVGSSQQGSYQEGMNDQVAPIVQPQIGNGEVAQGTIDLVQVFSPVAQTKTSHNTDSGFVAISVPQVMSQTLAPVSGMMELSMTRARDVYFEVAALKAGEKTSSHAASEDAAQEIIPAIFVEPIARDAVFENSTPHRPGETSARQRHTPKVPQNLPVDAVGLEAEIPHNQQSKPDQAAAANAESAVETAHDQAFADWHRGDSLADAAIPLRNGEGKEHRAAWPVVVALAGVGLIARHRRAPHACQQQPPRRKHSPKPWISLR